MNKTPRPHDGAVVELLRDDPDFADEYLAAALDDADQPRGREALLAALRHVAKHKAPPPDDNHYGKENQRWHACSTRRIQA
ncbi:DNA-binding protein [Herminiimonas sp. CN]|uniref:helix-turn-helix domain-containing transcriptional regulator n=1 Tax=Herminiimonas sp. CN TaxID=1349818 RepID=UPI0018731C2C|nr:hypothetical protein [Herminiimonas sp. CN]